MKLLLMCGIVLLSLVGCSKELACEDTGRTAVEIIKKALIGEDPAVFVKVVLNGEKLSHWDKLEKAAAAAGKEIPKPTWEVIFPNQTLELKDFVVSNRNKETRQVSCKATLASSMFNRGAETLSVEYTAQPTENGKDTIVTIGKSDINRATQNAFNVAAMKGYTEAVEKFEVNISPSSVTAPVAATPTPAPAAASQPLAPEAVAPPPPPAVPAEVAATPSTPAVANVGTINWSPGFDCAKVSTGPERLICGDKSLSELDVKLSLIYRKALESVKDKEALRTSQRNWRKFQRDACSDVACINKSYATRIDEVSAIK